MFPRCTIQEDFEGPILQAAPELGGLSFQFGNFGLGSSDGGGFGAAGLASAFQAAPSASSAPSSELPAGSDALRPASYGHAQAGLQQQVPSSQQQQQQRAAYTAFASAAAQSQVDMPLHLAREAALELMFCNCTGRGCNTFQRWKLLHLAAAGGRPLFTCRNNGLACCQTMELAWGEADGRIVTLMDMLSVSKKGRSYSPRPQGGYIRQLAQVMSHGTGLLSLLFCGCSSLRSRQHLLQPRLAVWEAWAARRCTAARATRAMVPAPATASMRHPLHRPLSTRPTPTR